MKSLAQELHPVEMAKIVAKAATLRECLRESISHHNSPNIADPSAVEKLDRWRHTASSGDDAIFTRRLAWDGLTLETIIEALRGRSTATPLLCLPPWTQTLLSASRKAFGLSDEMAQGRTLDHGNVTALELILLPFV